MQRLTEAEVDAWFAPTAPTAAMVEGHELVRTAAQAVEDALESLVDDALAGVGGLGGAADRVARAHALHRAYAQQIRRLVHEAPDQRAAIERVSASHAGVCELLSYVAVFEQEHERPVYLADDDGELEGDPEDGDDDDVAVARQGVLTVVGELEAQVLAELRGARWIANRAILLASAAADARADA